MSKIILILLLCSGCAKYQVVQELRVNMYHMYNPKRKKVEVILTEQNLQVGKWYRLKNINIIEIEDEK